MRSIFPRFPAPSFAQRPSLAASRRTAAGPDLGAQLARLDAAEPSIAVAPPASARPSTTGAAATSAASAPSFAGGDPIARLPPRAQGKLRYLRARQADIRDTLAALAGGRRDRLIAMRDDARGHLDRVERTGSGGEFGRVRASPAALAEARASLSGIMADLAALDERGARLKARLSRLPDTLADWLRKLPADVVIEDYTGKPPTLPAGRTAAQVLETVRLQIAELKADAHAVESAPYPAAVAKETARRYIEGLADRSAPDCMRTVELNYPPAFKTTMVQPPAGAPFIAVDTLGLLVWLHRDALIARLAAEIDDLADGDAGALTDAQRHAQERKIEAAILGAEREEEYWASAAEEQGVEIKRRDAADPLAVLGITITTPARQ